MMEGIAESDIVSQTSSTHRRQSKRTPKPKQHFDSMSETQNSAVPKAPPERKESATKKAPKAGGKVGGVRDRFFSDAAKRAKLEDDVPLHEIQEIKMDIKEAESSGAGPLDYGEDVLQAADGLMSLREECTIEQLRIHGPEAAMTLTNFWVYIPIRDKMAKGKAIATEQTSKQQASIRRKMAQQEALTGMSLPNTQSRSWREERRTNGVTGKEGGNRRKQATKGKSAKRTIEDDPSSDMTDCDTVGRASDDGEHNSSIKSTSSPDNDESDDLSASSQPKVLQISATKAKAGSARGCGQRVSRSS